MKLSILEQAGFHWLQLPNAFVLPLTILERNNLNFFNWMTRKLLPVREDLDVVNGDDLFSLFPKQGSGTIPSIGREEETAFFQGCDIIDFTSNASFSMEDDIPLVEKSKASLSFKKARKLLYKFNNVKQKQVQTSVLLEEYINNVSPTTAPGFLKKLKNNEMYVVVAALQTTSFSVQNVSDFVFDSNIDVETVKQCMTFSANKGSDTESTIFHEGTAPVTIAVKVRRINYNSQKDNFSLSTTPIKNIRGDVDF